MYQFLFRVVLCHAVSKQGTVLEPAKSIYVGHISYYFRFSRVCYTSYLYPTFSLRSEQFFDDFRTIVDNTTLLSRPSEDIPLATIQPLYESILQCKESLPELIDIDACVEERSTDFDLLQTFLKKV